MPAVTGPDNSQKDERFIRMVNQYQGTLLRTCYLLLRDRALAEDAVQETFLKAYSAMDSFRGESGEKTWLTHIAVNTVRDMRRKSWFRLVDRRVTPEDLPEAAVPFEEKDDSLTREIARLPQREKEALLLYFYQDMTMQEIAQALGLAVSTVSHRLKRAEERLKKAMTGGCDDA